MNSRNIVAAALCDATNGPGAWDWQVAYGGSQVWLHEADKFINELAKREWIVASMDEANKEVARILSLSDEEILAETIAAGLDPHEEAEKCRAIFRRAMERMRVNSPPSTRRHTPG